MKGINNPIGIKSLLPIHNPFIMNAYRFAGVNWATALLNWAKRKEITINGAAKTVTQTLGYTTAESWTKVGTTVTVDDAVAGKVDANAANSGTSSRVHKALSETANDEKWVMDFEASMNEIGTSGTGFRVCTLTAGTGQLDSTITSQDEIGISSNYIGGEALVFYNKNGTSYTEFTSGGQYFAYTPDVLYYFRLSRLSSDKVRMTVFADSGRSEVLFSYDYTVSSITGLTHVQHGTNAQTTAGRTFDMVGDNFAFYNGVTVVENIPSQQTATYSDNLSASTDINVAGGTVLTYGTNEINFDLDAYANAEEIYWDLDNLTGLTVSDMDCWTVRMRMDMDTFTQGSSGSQYQLGVGISSLTNNFRANQDFMGFFFTLHSGGAKLYATAVDGVNIHDGTETAFTSLPATGDVIYWELVKNGDTITVNWYSDSAFSVLVETQSSTDAGITGLRYLKITNDTLGSIDHEAIGSIDDIEFYANISEVNPATLTDYPLTIKIQGDADLQEKTTETLEDKFDGTDDWTDSDATNIGVNTTTDRLEFIAKRDGTNDSSVYDLTSVSDSAWVLRGEMVVTDWTPASNYAQYIFFGISDADSTASHSTSQDAIGLWFRSYNVSGSTIRNVWANGQSLDNTNESLFTMDLSARRIFIEVKRTSTTTMEVGLYADASYTIPLEVHNNITLPDTVASLRYLTVRNFNLSGGTLTFNGYFENVRFWNGITNPVTQETATFTDDFTGTDDWTDTNATIAVNTTTNVIDWNVGTTGNGTVYDLGFELDNKWVFEYDIQVDDVSSGTGNELLFILLASDTTHASSGTAHDYVGSLMQYYSTDYLKSCWGDGVNLASVDSTTLVNGIANTTYYMRHVYDGTTLTTYIFSDSARTVLTIKSEQVVDVNNLRYVKVSDWTPTSGSMTPNGVINKIEIWNGITSPNAEGRKIVFTDNAFDGDAVEYASETVSYDPINGDLEAVVKIPTLTTGADTTIQMYYDYAATNPSYVPEVIPTVSSILEQDFSADESWTHSSKTSISSGVLNWQNNATGTNLFHHAYRAIPQLKNDYFDVRFKLDIDVLSGSGYQDVASISWILCDANNTNSTSSGGTATGIGFRLGFGNASYVPVFEAFEVEGTGFNSDNAVDNIDFATTPTTGIIYIRLHRTSLTSVTVGIYSDSTYDNDALTEEETLTITSTINDLDIFQISTRNGSNETTRSVSGTVDDFTIVNNNREEATYDSNYKAIYNLHGNSVDSTVYGNDGTDTAVDWEQQNNSVGGGFNGTTSEIDGGSDVSLSNVWDGGGHVSAWINPKSDGEANGGVIIYKRQTSLGWSFTVREEASGFVKLQLSIGNATTFGTWKTTNAVVPINEMSRVEAIYNVDSTSNNPILIINGIKYTVGNGLDESSTPSGSRDDDVAAEIILGNNDAGTTTFDGLIDNVKVSDKIRPSSEGITAYNAEKSDSDIITAGDENTQ